MITIITTTLTFLMLYFGALNLNSTNPSQQNDRVIISKRDSSLTNDEANTLFNNKNNKQLITYKIVGIKLENSIVISPIIIDDNEFFRNRLANDKNIEGNFLENKNDIIISKKILETLNIQDPIGKEINYKIFIPYEGSKINGIDRRSILSKNQKFKIVDINNSDKDAYIRKDLIEDLASNKNNIIPSNQMLIFDNPSTNLPLTKNISIPDFDDNFNLETLQDNEKITKKFDSFNTNNQDTIIYFSSTLAENNANFTDSRYLNQTSFYLRFQNTVLPVKIGGIFESNTSSIKISENNLKKFNPEFFTNIDLYSDSQLYLNNLKSNNRNLKFEGDLFSLKNSLPNELERSLTINLFYTSFVSFLILGITILVYSIFKIRQNRRERNYLKNLRVSIGQIILFNLYNILIFSLFVLIAIFAIYYPFFEILKSTSSYVSSFSLNPDTTFLGLFILWAIIIVFFVSINAILTTFASIKRKN